MKPYSIITRMAKGIQFDMHLLEAENAITNASMDLDDSALPDDTLTSNCTRCAPNE